MSLDRRLSTLEYTVLGILWKKGGATAYAVTQEFAHSQTTAYRSGAGSIYPLLKRLAKAGLLTGGKDKTYRLTDRGVEELRVWYRSPLHQEDFSSLLDPLRSRVYFLAVLPPKERRGYFEAALSGLKMLEAECLHMLERYEAAGDPFSTIAAEGSLIETRARISWLKKVRKGL